MDKLQKDNYTALKKKLKEKYDKDGISALSEREILTLIISYSEPVFADIFADKLLSAFGSLNAVCSAAPEKLTSAGGISQSTAALLKLIPVLASVSAEKLDNTSDINSPHLAKQFSRCFSQTQHVKNLPFTPLQTSFPLLNSLGLSLRGHQLPFHALLLILFPTLSIREQSEYLSHIAIHMVIQLRHPTMYISLWK